MNEYNFQSENAAPIDPSRKQLEEMKPAIIVLSIALALFLTCIGLFAWNIVRMRNFESDYIKTLGVVVDYESHVSGENRDLYYYYVISYTFEGQEYCFTDNVGRNRNGYPSDVIGKYIEIYINPKHPAQAMTVMSSGSIAIGYSCCFCFFCFSYAIGMNLLLGKIGTSFKKRLLCIWGIEILLGIALFLLPWLWFPDNSFGEVFARMDGAIGIIVVCGLVLLATAADGAIAYVARSYNRVR